MHQKLTVREEMLIGGGFWFGAGVTALAIGLATFLSKYYPPLPDYWIGYMIVGGIFGLIGWVARKKADKIEDYTKICNLP